MCKRVWLTFAALLLTVQTVAASNLIVNGDFSGGFNGFQTDYVFRVDDSANVDDMWNPGTVGIDNSIVGRHSLWTDVADHTGNGNMLIANGRTDAESTVWRQTIAVNQGANYFFEGFGLNLCCNIVGDYGIPGLLFYINNVLIASDLTNGPGNWLGFSNMWYSASNSLAVLEIKNTSTVYSGNDFALDDLFFGEEPMNPTPEPVSFLLLGSGLLTAAAAAKRRQKV